MVALCIVLQVV